MSSRRLDTTIRGYRRGNVHKSYMRLKDAAEFYGYAKEHMTALASAAGAVYRLPKIVLICRSRLEDYMNHMEKVPGTGKYVNKFLSGQEKVRYYTVLGETALLRWRGTPELSINFQMAWC